MAEPMTDDISVEIRLAAIKGLDLEQMSEDDLKFVADLRNRPDWDGVVLASLPELGRFGRLQRDYGRETSGHAEPRDDERSSHSHPGESQAANSRPGTAEEADSPLIDTAAPYDAARLFLDRNFTSERRRTLHHHKGAFYRWSGTAYAPVAEQALRSKLYAFLDTCKTADKKPGSTRPVKPNAALVRNVTDALVAASHLDEQYSPPVWLDHFPDIPPHELVACENGLVHLPTLELMSHTPAFYNHNALEFAFEQEAEEPRHWLHFLGQLWPDDTASIETLQEIFGLCLTGDTTQQKAFLIAGPKRSGKGTIARVLNQLVGPDNVVAPTLAGIGTNFGLSPLIGKRVAIISDARLGVRSDQQVIAERLLSITGEDAITIDRKFMSAWTGRLQVRFVILTNVLPRFSDTSGALTSRFIVLKLTKSFYGREDHGLTDRLLSELPGILNWSIAGWRRLTERRYLRQPPSATDAVQDLEDLGSPIGAFLRDRCVITPGRSVAITRLFEAWREWCRQQGRDKPGTAQTFGRDLKAAVPGLATSRHRGYYERSRYYEGIDLA